jgi:hypothetical protein
MPSDGDGGLSTSASSGALTTAMRDPDGSGILGMTRDDTCDTRWVNARWDTDERGRGVASAAAFAPALERLLEASREADWVAEDPEHHLLPHVRRLCDERGWTVSAEIEDAVLVLGVGLPTGTDRRELLIAGYALVGTFSEESTHIEQRESDSAVELEVVTGMPGGSEQFAPHGHTVRLRLRAT